MEDRLRLLLESTNGDFVSWTSFINDVEEASSGDFAKLSSVYEPFLSKFPLCYGYWRKYAYHVACLCGADKTVEVYERAVQVATYSVDLWAIYCSFAREFYEDPEDVRRLYKRGLSYVGKDYLCHVLWDNYIEFEYSLRNWSNLAHIYIKTLAFPSKKLNCYYKSFKKLISIWQEEMQLQNKELVSSEDSLSCEVSDLEACNDSELFEVIDILVNQPMGMLKPFMLKKYISTGEELYKKSSQLDTKINYFEDAIHRPYFHPKPLDNNQLKNWHSYLDFVEMHGDFDWTVKLYERCLIPCANYQEFWIRYAEYMETNGGREIANFALEKASNFFMKVKGDAMFHLYCARFKERIGDNFGARASFLLCKSDTSSNFIENVDREANMEKRLGNIEGAILIYEKAILLAEERKNFQILSLLYVHFARFTFVVTKSIDAARIVFDRGIQKIPWSKSLLEGMIQFMILHGAASQLSYVDSLVANALTPQPEAPEGLSLADQEDISLLFIEFADLYGTIHEIEKAWNRHRKLFPHLLRPLSLHCLDDLKIATLEKGKYGNNLGISLSSYSPSTGNDNPGLGKHLPSPEKNPSDCSNDAESGKFESDEGNAIHLKLEKLIFVEDAERNCRQEAKLPLQTSAEGHIVTQVPSNTMMDAKISDQSLDHAYSRSPEVISTSAIESFSVKSPIDDTWRSQTTSPEICNAPQQTSLNFKKSETWDMSDNDHVADLPESNEEMNQSGASSFAQNLEKAISSNGVNQTQGATSSQVNEIQQTPNSSTAAHDPRYQRQLDSSCSSICLGVNPQMLNGQKPVWQGQMQNCSQEQTQYMIANGQVYQTGSFPCQWPNLQQQCFTPAYSQVATQLVPQPEVQHYQHALQSNGQYGYFHNGQGYLPEAWHYYYYYQQQLHNLQMLQQNLQLQQQQQQQQQINTGLSQHLPLDDQEQLDMSQRPPQQQTTERQNLPKHQQQRIEQDHHQPQIQQDCQSQSQHHVQMLHMQKEHQQTNNQLQQLQQQQLLIQHQQELLLQQQHYQLYLQQNWQEQPQQQHCPQVQITPLEIQALSDKYLKGQSTASEHVEAEQPGSTCPSSQIPSS